MSYICSFNSLFLNNCALILIFTVIFIVSKGVLSIIQIADGYAELQYIDEAMKVGATNENRSAYC